jgi:hypothetical protein
VVVTAAHCVDPAELDPGATLSVFTGDVFTYGVTKPDPDTVFAIQATHMLNGFTMATAPTNGRDLGVVVTVDALSITPLPLNRTAPDASWVGRSARVVGFGDAVDMTPASAGTRHDILLPITEVNANFIVEQGEAGTSCEGDSGGATLISVGNLDVVAGIHAANLTLGGRTCLGGANVDTRIDRYAATFIDPIVAAIDGDTAVDDGGVADGGMDGGIIAEDGSPSPSTGSANGASCSATRKTRCERGSWGGFTSMLLMCALSIRRRIRGRASSSLLHRRAARSNDRMDIAQPRRSLG